MPPYEILPLPPLWLVVAHPPHPLPNPWGGWEERRRTEDGTIYIYMYCIHIWLYVYIYILFTYVHIHVHVYVYLYVYNIYTRFFLKTHMYIYKYLYVYTLHTCMYMCICIYCLHTYMYIYRGIVYIYECRNMCIYMYIYICMYVYVYVCIYIYVIHTHKYIDTTFSVCCQIFAWNRIRDYSSQETSNVNQRKWRKSTKQVPMINSNLSVQFPGQITRWTAGSWIHPNYACLWGTVHYFHTSWYSSFGTVMAKKTTPFSEAPKNHNISGLHSHCIHRKISI